AWALPGSFNRVGAAFVKHFHNEVAMQAHGRMAIDSFCLCGFCHYCHFTLLFSLRLPAHSRLRRLNSLKNLFSYNCLQKSACTRSYTDREIFKKVVSLGVCLKTVSEARWAL